MDINEPVDNFTTSREFNQLLTLPIKCPEMSEAASAEKENCDIEHNVRKHVLPGGDLHMECEESNRHKLPDEFDSPIQIKRVKFAQHDWNSSPSNLFASMNVDESPKPLCIQNSSPRTSKIGANGSPSPHSRTLARSLSESAVKQAIEKSSSDPLLLGDCSQRYVLPFVISGKHEDLKEIDCATVADVLDGKYASQLNSFKVVDCRYPYEYNGGHIKGAVNLYTQQQIYTTFMENKTTKKTVNAELKRNIIIFHCEFSSQRAPNLCRYLRSADRSCNMSTFPALHYPELYILYGGYKTFFQSHETYCEPPCYLTMLDENHKDDLKLYKSKSANEVVSSKPKFAKRLARSISVTSIKQPKF